MQTPTDKQLNMIIYLIERSESKTVEELYSKVSTHNSKYKTPLADFRRIILQERIEKNATRLQASHIIKLLMKQYPRSPKKLVDIFHHLKLI